jgi:hypothetical protein
VLVVNGTPALFDAYAIALLFAARGNPQLAGSNSLENASVAQWVQVSERLFACFVCLFVQDVT